MSNEVTITDADRSAAKEIQAAIAEGAGYGYLTTDTIALIIARHRSEREKRLVEAIELYQEIERLHRTCVVCGCALVDERDAPFCETSCTVSDDHEFDWRGAMCDHHRMLEAALAKLEGDRQP